jgi:NHL repeat
LGSSDVPAWAWSKEAWKPILLGALFVSPLMVAQPADAAPIGITGFIGGPVGTGVGGLFSEPRDVAVYAGNARGAKDDKIYVVEAGPGVNRVQRLDGDGNFELMWGRDVVTGNAASGYERCKAAVRCKRAPAGSNAGEFARPVGVAVSQATGDVYVMDAGNRRIQRFDRDGGFLGAWGWGVATGAARFEICRSGCRRGRLGGPEGDGNAGQIARSENGSLAIRPGASEDLFVTDGGNQRLIEFSPEGRVLRVWGWGVSTGSNRFEVCGGHHACRSGRSNPKGFPPGDSPGHVAVDRGGIVYGSSGIVLDSPSSPLEPKYVVRFDADAVVDPPLATAALLPAFRPGILWGHTTLGMEIDPTTGDLITLRDGLGTLVLNIVHRPSATADDPGPSKRLVEVRPYIESLNGVGVSPTTGAVYLVRGRGRDEYEDDLALTGCPSADGTEVCHGLAILGEKGELGALVDPPADAVGSTATLTGTIDPHGIARYRFAVSRDGRSWRQVGESRYVTGRGTVSVSQSVGGLATGAVYRSRMIVVRRLHGGGSGGSVVVSEGSFLAATGHGR